jgi:hypothetical protein
VLPGIEAKELPKEAFNDPVNRKSKKKTVKPALPKSK